MYTPGTTESCTAITTWSLENKCDLSGSAGQLIPGVTARVEKPDGALAEFDEPGELVVRTPSLALGYAGNPEAYVGGPLRRCYKLDASPCSTKETFVNG